MNREENIKLIADGIKNSKKITVLTGAGVSTYSGIKDFRSKNGIYKEYGEEKVEKVLNLNFFQKNPELFWEEYKEIFGLNLNNKYKPNEIHYFLKKIENMGKEINIFTQNIDGLHEKAGSSKVFNMHGSGGGQICLKCKRKYRKIEEIPKCDYDGEILKPDIVLFDEEIFFYEKAIEEAKTSDLFIVMGTSLNVYPVANIPSYLPMVGKPEKIIINRNFTNKDVFFNIKLYGELKEVIELIEKTMC